MGVGAAEVKGVVASPRFKQKAKKFGQKNWKKNKIQDKKAKEMSNEYIAEPLPTEQKFFNSQLWGIRLQDSMNLGHKRSKLIQLKSTFYAKNFTRRLFWSISILQPFRPNLGPYS